MFCQFNYLLNYCWKSIVKSIIFLIIAWCGLVEPGFESSLNLSLESEGEGLFRVWTQAYNWPIWGSVSDPCPCLLPPHSSIHLQPGWEPMSVPWGGLLHSSLTPTPLNHPPSSSRSPGPKGQWKGSGGKHWPVPTWRTSSQDPCFALSLDFAIVDNKNNKKWEPGYISLHTCHILKWSRWESYQLVHSNLGNLLDYNVHVCHALPGCTVCKRVIVCQKRVYMALF